MRVTRSIIPASIRIIAACCIAYLVLWGAFSATLAMVGSQSPEHAHVRAYLTGPLFAENTLDFLEGAERSHMTDVKQIIDIAFLIGLFATGILIGIAAAFWTSKHRELLLERALRTAGWTILGIVTFLGLASVLNFTAFWYVLHAILFPQGNWMFPYDSLLIQMYPEAFFFRFTFIMLAYIVSAGLVLLLLGTWLQHALRHEREFKRQT